MLAFCARRLKAQLTKNRAMARKARVEFAGALYHLLDRGDRQEAIFHDDADRELFLATLAQACTRCGWRVHALVLMTNHYHLLVETPEANLVSGMRWFQTTYTVRFNRRHAALCVLRDAGCELPKDTDSLQITADIRPVEQFEPHRTRLS